MFSGRFLRTAFLATSTLLGSAQAAQTASMKTGGLTGQPIGHHEFCKDYPSECKALPSKAPEQMTPEKWHTIWAVNRDVNNMIMPFSDQTIYGEEEVWAYPEDEIGDCEDYVLLKRDALIELGFSPSNLLITLVRLPDGENHAVLTFRTDKGDYVLDNLTNDILHWWSTDHAYIKRQSARHAGWWVDIAENQPVPRK